MFCQECGKELNDKAVVCVHCGVSTGTPLHGHSHTNLSGFALTSLLFGVAATLLRVPMMITDNSLEPLSSGIAIFAILFGLLARSDLKRNPSKYGGRGWKIGLMTGALVIGSFIIAILNEGSAISPFIRALF